MDDYNYAHFPEDLEEPVFEAFKAHLKAGERAPTGTLVDAHSGDEVRLATLWRAPLVVLEFGSLT